MTKILLVEDDKSLREIYGVRLLAEGYDIVSANDGEQALAVAIKERPVLIITDVMMPKISGFDMLDILRSTTETRDIKVIMMTALSSDDQRQRGEQMGADRYLVKSQVGIEDVVRTVHEVLGDKPSAPPPPAGGTPPTAPPPAPAGPAPTAPAAPVGMPPSIPAAPAPHPTMPAPAPVAPAPQAPPRAPVPPASATTAQPAQAVHSLPPTSSNTPRVPSARQRIIQPISNPGSQVNINDLLDRELAREAGMAQPPQVPTTDQEKQIVADQIKAAEDNGPTPDGVPQVNIGADGQMSRPPIQPAPPREPGV